MNVQTIGSHRPRLSLAFARREQSRPASARRSPTLSGNELRRPKDTGLSEMIG